jgi:glycosyltransferase involved in cell wall biosynthesis
MPFVVHLSPTYFSSESYIGGGERFVEELSRTMADQVRVRFVSFGAREFREQVTARYERVILRSRTANKMMPFSERLFRELRDADVIHCHQYYVLPTFLAACYGKWHGKKVFISDSGGGGWTPGYHIDQSRWIVGHLPISQYAARKLPGHNQFRQVIYAGVDLERYPMRRELKHDGSLVFLGRILPHKGIHYLIDGVPPDVPVRIIGPVGDEGYYQKLQGMAAGKQVEFLHGLSDQEVRGYLTRAMALVHPTPVDEHGSAGVNELFGLAVVEAMACGCPVILSDAASLPELIQQEESGLLVPPNNPLAIGDAVRRLRVDEGLWNKLSNGARKRVEAEFVWSRVVDRCLGAYSGAISAGKEAPSPAARI